VAATNRDINEEILKGRFRADLFYRLNMYNIKIPPLKDRKNDVIPLARHFLKRHALANNKKFDGLDPDLAERLLQYSFPGNVRELENMIAAAVLLENSKTLSLASAQHLLPYNGPERRRHPALLTLEEIEKRHIQHVLDVTNGNRPKAAKILGVNVSTVYRKLEKYDISGSV
jgi:transcriptional regulator with PAS, ATPase and Fis domain